MISIAILTIIIISAPADSLLGLNSNEDTYEMKWEKNYEEYLKVIEVSPDKRAMAAKSKPTAKIITNGDELTITTLTTSTAEGPILRTYEKFNGKNPICQLEITTNEYKNKPDRMKCFDEAEASFVRYIPGQILVTVKLDNVEYTRFFVKKMED